MVRAFCEAMGKPKPKKKCDSIAMFHCSIKTVISGKGKSTVGASAHQSGKK